MRLKDIFKLVAATVIMLCVLVVPANAEVATVAGGTCGDSLTWTLDDAGTLTISGKGDMDSYVLSSDVPWGAYTSDIMAVIISDGVTSIGNYAFDSCSGLTTVTIPDSITSIGNYAFYDCSHLTSVAIPARVTNIGTSAFGGWWSSMTGIWVDANNAIYSSDSYGVLYNKDQTQLIQAPGGLSGEYSIPNGVISIEDSAFYACGSLTSITIPDSITSIGDNVFYGCSNLSYNIYDSANYLGNANNPYLVLMEQVDTSITVFTVHGSTRVIGNRAFNGCSNLTTVEIPDNVVSICDNAFANCSSMVSITIPASVSNIGTDIIQSWNMTGIWVDTNNAVYSSDSYGVLYTKGQAKLLEAPTRLAGDFVIPNSVVGIGDYAFDGCSSLTSIIIQNSVTNIGCSAFYNCSGLSSVVIPDSVTSIGDQAFQNCNGLTSITIPNGVTSIGDQVFASCASLTSVTIPDDVTSIGDDAFYRCSRLTSVTIPDKVTSIGEKAFYGCSSLTSVTIGNSVTNIGTSAFGACTSLVEISVAGDNVVYSSDSYGALYNKDQTNLILVPEGLIGEFIVPDSVTSINDAAFFSCKNLTHIMIPDSVMSIGGSAFEYCSGLIGVTIGNGVTRIDDYAFNGCKSLTSVIIPNSVTSIGYSAFYNCSGLTSVVIPGSVTSIGDATFWCCDSLTIVTIGNGVTKIGNFAFYRCSDLTDVYYTGTSQQWASVSVGGSNECLTGANIVCLGDSNCIVVTPGKKSPYSSLSEAVENATDGYVQFNKDIAEGVTIPVDAYVDLNGYTLIGDVTIADGATLHVFDSATADYTAQNRGKIVGKITGNLARSFNTPTAYGHNYKYLALEEEPGVWSFHRYYLTVKSVVLRPYMKSEGYTGTAVDYKTHFKCNELVAKYVTAYGTKLVGDTTAYADYMANGYSLLNGAENTNEQCTWLTGTFKTTNSAEANAANALRKPVVSAYITLIDGAEITSAGVQRSLQDMIVYANGLTELTATEERALGKMYNLFKDILDTWTVDISNIKRYAAELV